MTKGKPVRRPNHRQHGTQVTICGRSLSTVDNLICTLHSQHRGHIHASIAIADDGSIVAIVDDITKEEVDMWQLVDPPE